MKKIFICFILLLFMIPAISQDKKEPEKEPEKKAGEAEKVSQTIYTEITLEDFETSQYSNTNLKFIQSKEQQGSLQVRDQYAAEYNNSKKYLGVKVFAKKGDTFQIFPAKPLEINKYCKAISVWVYGKKFSGELTMIVQDVSGTNHRLVFGNLQFLGWKKLTVNLDKKIKQQDQYLEKEKSLRILHFQYRPGNDTLHPEWQYFYIDDITATVRDKYKDKQNDDW
jgi:hypothetical protein